MIAKAVDKNGKKTDVHNKNLLLEGLLHAENYSTVVPDLLGPFYSHGVDTTHSLSEFSNHFISISTLSSVFESNRSFCQ